MTEKIQSFDAEQATSYCDTDTHFIHIRHLQRYEMFVTCSITGRYVVFK
jgi:hypothetical protein